ncbi:MAG TPA: hypothetical protein VGI81_15490 [Tepidisphaeraceae bacterium]
MAKACSVSIRRSVECRATGELGREKRLSLRSAARRFKPEYGLRGRGGIAATLCWRERELLFDLRRAAGCCVTCGYDLRASNDRCSDCGAAIAPAVVPMRNRPIKPWWNSASEP